MIPIRKFLGLDPEKQLRKLWRILFQYEAALRSLSMSEAQSPANSELLNDAPSLIAGLYESPDFAAPSQIAMEFEGMRPYVANPNGVLRAAGTRGYGINDDAEESIFFEALAALNALRHGLAKLIGKEAAEWDLFSPYERNPVVASTMSGRRIGSRLDVYCDDIRSPYNIGSVFRTALAFGFSKIYLSPGCPSPRHPRAERSAMGAVEHIDWSYASLEEAFAECAGTENRVSNPSGFENDERIPGFPIKGSEPVLFAFEQGGTDIGNFRFPDRGLVVVGSEELGVSPRLLEQCRAAGGIVSVALPGPKASLNVAGAFAILAHRWSASLEGNKP